MTSALYINHLFNGILLVTLDFRHTRFLTSAAKLDQCPEDSGREVAFCGRSNAGKSSAINFLTSRQKLARTSKTPGRTQLINFFTLSEDFRLVDLPGYGYARVPDQVKKDWHRNIDDYLRNRKSLCGLVLVMDIRHPLKNFDEMMLEWAGEANMPVHILLTKCDKLKKGAAKASLETTFKKVRENIAGVSIQLFSSNQKVGRDLLIQKLEDWQSR